MHSNAIASIPLGDARYPAALAAISDPPPILWTKGQLDSLRGPMVAVVGSRAASPLATTSAVHNRISASSSHSAETANQSIPLPLTTRRGRNRRGARKRR